MTNKRVLITGLGGFTGRHLAAELRSHGWQVCGLGLQPADPAWGADAYLQADLADAQSLTMALDGQSFDAVVHLAAIAFVGHGDPADFYRVNLMGTRNLLSALAHGPAPSCVLVASSANVYGNTVEGQLSEDTPPRPANDYAVSKLAMEHMARLWSARLPLVLVRPFNYTGVGQTEDFLLPKIVGHFRRREPVIELGNLDVWRDFSDVRAVVQAYRRLIDLAPAGQTVNVCSGRTQSLREVLDMARAISGHDIEIKVNPAFVRSNEVRTLCGDPTRLRGLIGPWDTPPLQDTLRWMLEA